MSLGLSIYVCCAGAEVRRQVKGTVEVKRSLKNQPVRMGVSSVLPIVEFALLVADIFYGSTWWLILLTLLLSVFYIVVGFNIEVLGIDATKVISRGVLYFVLTGFMTTEYFTSREHLRVSP